MVSRTRSGGVRTLTEEASSFLIGSGFIGVFILLTIIWINITMKLEDRYELNGILLGMAGFYTSMVAVAAIFWLWVI